MKKSINKIILLFIFFFIFPFVAKAGTANISMTGGTVIVGNEITITFKLNSSNDGNLVSFGGYLSYDASYLEPITCKSNSALGVNYNSSNKKFAYMDNSVSGISSGNIGYCTFKTKAVGTTSVTVKSPTGTNNSSNLSINVSKATVTIKNPPSGNNNLSSLSVTPGSISFNKGTTNYNINVDSNVTSVNISATAEDSNAKVTGTGTRNLSYGNNALGVVVTAENGNKKTYTINVNRKDDRSSNNNLSSLTVSNGTLSPGFNKNTTSYDIEVPFSVTKLELSAKAEDSKSKVNISNPELVSEEITLVRVTVTAENGSSKTYTINAKRGKDPNKPLSDNNYLKVLEVSEGMLSPAFDKDKMNYAVYLPYEIPSIEITTEVEDTKYGKLHKEEDSNLSVGANIFRYTVTAENGDERVYTVTVVRNKAVDNSSSESNVYLKSLVLDNGTLAAQFDKTKNVVYYYENNKNISIKEALPEIEENSVTTYKLDDGFLVLVESPNGERGFYVLVKKNNLIFIVIIISCVIILGLLVLLFKDKLFHKKINKKLKK